MNESIEETLWNEVIERDKKKRRITFGIPSLLELAARSLVYSWEFDEVGDRIEELRRLLWFPEHALEMIKRISFNWQDKIRREFFVDLNWQRSAIEHHRANRRDSDRVIQRNAD